MRPQRQFFEVTPPQSLLQSPLTMRILITGGGFAGLTLAALLRQTGIEPVVIEKSARYEPVGYVIGLWPLGGRILHGLNLYDEFLARSVESRHYKICDRSGDLINEYEMGPVFGHYGPLRSVTRHELLDVLLKGAGPENVRMGTTLQSLEQNDQEVRVRFSSGEEATFDFVAGCDGIRSQTRQLLFGDLPLDDTGWAGWAWWIDPGLLRSDTIQEYWGGDCFLGIYPAKNKTCCFSAFPFPKGKLDESETRPERIRDAFKNFGGIVPKILETLPTAGQISFTRFADIKLEEWHQGRVLLLGDAGQGILPTAGIGATMAMESAAVLADELRRVDANTISLAIEFFVKRRRHRVDHVQAESRELAHLMFTESATKSWIVRKVMKFYSLNRLLKGFSRTLEEPI